MFSKERNPRLLRIFTYIFHTFVRARNTHTTRSRRKYFSTAEEIRGQDGKNRTKNWIIGSRGGFFVFLFAFSRGGEISVALSRGS